jgi:hypothetical protein
LFDHPEASEDVFVAYDAIDDGEIYVIQQRDSNTDEVLQEILMTRELALQVANDILESLEKEEVFL